MKTRAAAIIVAAGQATRFGSPKVLSPVAGVPAIVRVVRTFQSVPAIDEILIVINPAQRDQFAATWADAFRRPEVQLIAGGERRQDSVMAGVQAAGDAKIVVVHDGARPLVTADLIEATIAAIEDGADASIAAIPVTDTIKRVEGSAVETVDRANLWRAQTPQAFKRKLLMSLIQDANRDGIEVTDEATLIERAGGKVTLVQGSHRNLKMTVPEDLALLEALIAADTAQSRTRTGIGYDVHRLVAGRPLVLGGVAIPSDLGLDGHSDADVVLHAICDALLGACALGDIGQHFPPSDDQFRGISSLVLLERVRDLLTEGGYSIANIDATVIAEAPKVGPYVDAMRQAIGSALQISQQCVGIKATTNEGIGFAGRREGIAAMAVATVSKAG